MYVFTKIYIFTGQRSLKPAGIPPQRPLHEIQKDSIDVQSKRREIQRMYD